jgi:hypothetical protein
MAPLSSERTVQGSPASDQNLAPDFEMREQSVTSGGEALAQRRYSRVAGDSVALYVLLARVVAYPCRRGVTLRVVARAAN